MKTGGDHPTSGFTIVETLIVLAVTSALFASAVLLVNGRQAKAQFQTGITGLQQQFRQLIGETTAGYYANNGNFKCSASISAPVSITAGTNTSGTNGACIFIGKTIQFGGANTQQFTVYPLAANRLSGGKEVGTYAQAWPTAIARGGVYNTSAPDDFTAYTTKYGLTFVWGSANGGTVHTPGTAPYALAFLSSLASYNASGAVNSAAQQFQLSGFSGAWTGSLANTKDVVDNINREASRGVNAYPQLDSAELCYASGGTNQSGLIQITNGLTVTLRIFEGSTCS